MNDIDTRPPENTAEPLVIVGSGTAGYTLARQFRALDSTRPLIVLTADGGEAYSKPLLSNALAKGQTPASLVMKPAAAQAEAFGCELHTWTRVTAIDRAARRLHTTRGEFAYGDLVLALGAEQRPPLPPGAEPGWVQTVNSLDDFGRWYESLVDARRVLLIGAGLIGCEFADDLMSHGLDVELVDPAPWPLSRLLPEAAGRALEAALTERGARLHLGRSLSALAREEAGQFTATLDDGQCLQVDRVLSATGLRPATALASEAGLACGLGIRVDRQLRSSDPHIHAIGDCAETPAGFLPYILPIMAQARTLADVLAGKGGLLAMKAMPVMVKTTSLRIAVCPPRAGAEGEWRLSGEGRDLEAVFHGPDGTPLGFVVTGRRIARQAELARDMPPLIAA